MGKATRLVLGKSGTTSLPGGLSSTKRGTLGMPQAEGFSFQGFLRGYLANSNGPAWVPPNKTSSRNQKYRQKGVVPEDVRAPERRAEKSSGYKNHYEYFKHVHCQQQISGHEDRENQCKEQQAKVRRQRVLFAPFDSGYQNIMSCENSVELQDDEMSQPSPSSTSRPSIGLARFKCLVGNASEQTRASVSSEEAKKEESSKPTGKESFDADPTSPIGLHPQDAMAPPSSGKKQKSNEKGGGGGFMSVLKALSNQQQQRKEACDSIRFLVFGCLGNESMGAKEKQNLYKQRRGTKEEIFKLYDMWSQMDEDGSGDVEFQEFLNFFSKNKSDRLLGMRCVKYLVGSGEDANGCTIEDMMKLIWLETRQEDIDCMMRWFKEAAFDHERIPTPPLLSKKKKRQLMENFEWIDKSGAGTITYTDLVDSGLVDEEMAVELMKKYDADGSGDLDCDEFLELMCPFGYRAHANVREAVDKRGQQLHYVSNSYFSGWTVKGAFEDLQKKLLDESEHTKLSP